MDIIPIVSIRPSKIVVYNEYSYRRYSENSLETHVENFKSNSTNGLISKSAESKLRNAIDWLIFLSPYKLVYSSALKKRFRFKINFITLTLPSEQLHSDSFIKKNMLNHFLQILRYKHNVKYYVWRAESQTNGNIHFHITTNVFIEYYLIRKYWNRILNKHNYIKSYSKNMKAYYTNGFKMSDNKHDKRNFRQQYKAFIWNKLTGWQNPNSTDIHSVKNIKHLGLYLCKYFSKNSWYCPTCDKHIEPNKSEIYYENYKNSIDIEFENAVINCPYCGTVIKQRIIDGRLWFVSQKLSQLDKATDEIHEELKTEIGYLCKKFAPEHKSYDHAEILYLDYNKWKNFNLPHLKSIFEKYFNDIIFNQEFKI